MSKQALAEATPGEAGVKPGEAGVKPGCANWLSLVGALQHANGSPPEHGQAKPGEAGAKPDQQISAQYTPKHQHAEAKPGRSRGVHPLFASVPSQNQCSAPPPIYITNKDWGGAGDPSKGSKHNEPSRILEGGACRPPNGLL